MKIDNSKQLYLDSPEGTTQCPIAVAYSNCIRLPIAHQVVGHFHTLTRSQNGGKLCQIRE